jgi:Ca-activated chloride channel family protein
MIVEYPWLLYLAPLVALVAGIWLWRTRRRRRALARAWSHELAALAARRGRWTPLVLSLVVMAGLVALAGPRGGRGRITSDSNALSMVLAIDISRSMLAEDTRPSRLERALQEARRLVQDSEGDRIGLIAFAGRSYILSPLTVDGSAVRMHLDALDPDLAGTGGSDLSAVLTQGTELLAAAEEVGDRVLVLFTDGEAHDSLDGIREAASRLQDAGVRLVLIAEGEPEGVRIPMRDSAGTLIEYKLDENGSVVITRRTDETFIALTDAADATLIPADAPDQAGAAAEIMATFKRNPTVQTRASDLLPRAWIPLLAAALLLGLHTLTRRGASLFVILLAFGTATAAAQRPSAGERALADGSPDAAATEFLEAARGTVARDTAFYNAGTSALAAGRLDVARGALTEAAKSLDPELRYRALYNLGVVNLLEARHDTAARGEKVDAAVNHLRQALLLAPNSERARWNLELAERMRPPEPPPSSGGGGGGTPPPPTPTPPRGGMSENQAEQILESMAREERETRQDQQRRVRTSSSGGKDW